MQSRRDMPKSDDIIEIIDIGTYGYTYKLLGPGSMQNETDSRSKLHIEHYYMLDEQKTRDNRLGKILSIE
jgi:hypothetical protein